MDTRKEKKEKEKNEKRKRIDKEEIEKKCGWWKHSYLCLKQSESGGLGLHTTKDIAVGALILREQPIATNDSIREVAEMVVNDPRIRWLYPCSSRTLCMKKKKQKALKDESKKTKKEKKDIDIALQIVQKNNWGDNGKVQLYLHMSTINHSCIPNTQFTDGGGLYALRDIKADEELTTLYVPTIVNIDDKEVRSQHLKNWMNKCLCSRCTERVIPTKEEINHIETWSFYSKRQTGEFWG